MRFDASAGAKQTYNMAKKYCVQLSTGLIFRSEQQCVYNQAGYPVEKGNTDKSTPINGYINGTTHPYVMDMIWREKHVITEWEE